VQGSVTKRQQMINCLPTYLLHPPQTPTSPLLPPTTPAPPTRAAQVLVQLLVHVAQAAGNLLALQGPASSTSSSSSGSSSRDSM